METRIAGINDNSVIMMSICKEVDKPFCGASPPPILNSTPEKPFWAAAEDV
jgi:hypothetical protein